MSKIILLLTQLVYLHAATIYGEPICEQFADAVFELSTPPLGKRNRSGLVLDPARPLQLVAMRKRYKYENIYQHPENIWSNSAVAYLTGQGRRRFLLTVKKGLWYQNGKIFDTADAQSAHKGGEGKVILVMTSKGEVFASKFQERGRFHHSSFLSGADVAFAGEAKFTNGRMTFISNLSGHYRPANEIVRQFLDILEFNQIDISSIIPSFVGPNPSTYE